MWSAQLGSTLNREGVNMEVLVAVVVTLVLALGPFKEYSCKGIDIKPKAEVESIQVAGAQ